MRELFRFIHHISKIGGAGGGKRVFYALLHIVAVVLAFAAGYGAYWLFANFSNLLSQNLLFILIFIPAVIVCVGAAILFFLQGAVAQVILIVFAAIDIKDPEERAGNIVALLIAVLSLVALGVIAAIVFTTVL